MYKVKHKSALNLTNIFLYVFSPIFFGVLIYIFSRTNNIYALKFLNFNNKKIEIPDWVNYNLVDGIWSFSLTMLIIIIWDWQVNKNSILWILVILVLSLLMEIEFGTFDWMDVLFLIIGFLLPFFLFAKKITFKLT